MDIFVPGVEEVLSSSDSEHNNIEPLQSGSKSDKAGTRLDILYREYQRATEKVDRQLDHIIRVATIGFSATGALLVLVASGIPGTSSGTPDASAGTPVTSSGSAGTLSPFHFEEWVYWLAPILLVLLYVWIINHLYHMTFSSYYVRDLEDEIAKETKISFFHYENAVVRALASGRTGFLPYILTTVMGLVFAFIVYATLVGVSFFKLKETEDDFPVWRLALFVLTQLIFSIALLISSFGVFAQLRSKYDYWKDKFAKDTIADDSRYGVHSEIWQIVSYALLPRPFDFVYKGGITALAMVATALALHIPITGDLWALTFWVIICVDFLAKQATYIWNDMLDMESDRLHPSKSETRLLSKLLTNGGPAARIGLALFLSRSLLAFVLAFVLAVQFHLAWVPILIAVIFAWQVFYDRVAKKQPLRRTAIAAAGYSQRALAGGLVAMSSAGFYDVVWLVLVSAWTIVFMFRILCGYWWAERDYQWREKFNEQLDQAKEGTRQSHPETKVKEHPYPDTGDQEVLGTPDIWFLETARKFARRADGVLILLGLVIAYFYAGPSPTKPWLVTDPGAALTNRLALDASEIGEALRKVLGSLWNQRVFSGTFEPMQFGALAAGGTLAGTVLAFTLCRKLAYGKRGRWAVLLIGLSAITALLAPADSRIAVLAFMLPLIVVVLWEDLSFEEITKPEKRLRDFQEQLPKRLEVKLFRPRGARISVRPVQSTDAAVHREWAEHLFAMYKRWTETSGLTRHPTDGDGGSELDLLVEVPWTAMHKLDQLRGESGLHRLLPECDDDASDAPSGGDYARVYIQFVSAIATPDMGNGVESPPSYKNRAEKMPNDVDRVRVYARCAQREGGEPTYRVVEEHTNTSPPIAGSLASDILEARKSMALELANVAQCIQPASNLSS